jgi:hypothetical protein
MDRVVCLANTSPPPAVGVPLQAAMGRLLVWLGGFGPSRLLARS